MIKTSILAITAAAFLTLCGSAALAQDDHNQQVAKDYYDHHKANPPAGLRDGDRLNADQESRLQQGTVLDKDMRRRVHPAPEEMRRQLSPPPAHERYVAIGGHIATIDNSYKVKSVIHLHN